MFGRHTARRWFARDGITVRDWCYWPHFQSSTRLVAIFLVFR